MDNQIASMLGQGGITASLIAVIFWVGKHLVAELKMMRTEIALKIDSFKEEISDHTKQDLAAHADVRRDLAVMNGRVGQLLDLREPGATPRRRKLARDGE